MGLKSNMWKSTRVFANTSKVVSSKNTLREGHGSTPFIELRKMLFFRIYFYILSN